MHRSYSARSLTLTVDNVSKSYQTIEGPVPVLKGVNLQLSEGQSLALTGESGSGKSTLLHLVAGLDRPDAGTIIVNGLAIDQLSDKGLASYRRCGVGLIFQQFNLIPSMTVSSNISFHAKLAGRFDKSWEQELLKTLDIHALLDRYPEQLSGGQQQRVAIARTLASRPSLILADEPTGNLDENTADTVLDVMLALSKTAGISLLMVTHSSRLAAKLDSRVVLSRGKVSP